MDCNFIQDVKKRDGTANRAVVITYKKQTKIVKRQPRKTGLQREKRNKNKQWRVKIKGEIQKELGLRVYSLHSHRRYLQYNCQ